MSTAAIAIVLVVVAAVLVVTVVATIGSAGGGQTRTGNDDPWLESARAAVELARRVASRLGDEPAEAQIDVIDELDELTARMAELSTTAPTRMDIRVCRNLGVRSQALQDELQSQQLQEKTLMRGRSSATTPSRDRRADFELAVRDLAEHVNLV